MNSTVPSPKNWPSELKARKRSKIRPIDSGTSLDVIGNLRRLVREIERGEIGAVTDCVCAIRTAEASDNGTQLRTFHWGSGTIETAHYMASTTAARLER